MGIRHVLLAIAVALFVCAATPTLAAGLLIDQLPDSVLALPVRITPQSTAPLQITRARSVEFLAIGSGIDFLYKNASQKPIVAWEIQTQYCNAFDEAAATQSTVAPEKTPLPSGELRESGWTWSDQAKNVTGLSYITLTVLRAKFDDGSMWAAPTINAHCSQ